MKHAFPDRAFRVIAAVLDHGEAIHSHQKAFEFGAAGGARQVSGVLKAAYVFTRRTTREVRELIEERGDGGIDPLRNQRERKCGLVEDLDGAVALRQQTAEMPSVGDAVDRTPCPF